MITISSLIKSFERFGIYRLGSTIVENKPRILMYHRFSKNDQKDCVSSVVFEEQVKFISTRYTSSTMCELAKKIYHRKELPKNQVVITVDDGYQDFYQVAFPILKKYNMRATLYATTGFIENGTWLWPDKLKWILSHAQDLSALESITCGQSVGLDKNTLWAEMVKKSLSLSEVEKQEYHEELLSIAGLVLPDTIPEAYAPCTAEQLREMQEYGIEIGGHTVTHPSLGQVSKNQAMNEIQQCEEWLNRELGRKERTFCYPNGMPSDYKKETEKILEDSDFLCSVVAFNDKYTYESRYAIRRFGTGNDMFQFKKAVSGIELIGNIFRKKELKHV